MKRWTLVLAVLSSAGALAQTEASSVDAGVAVVEPTPAVVTPPPAQEPPKALDPPPLAKSPEPPSARDRLGSSIGIGFLGTANVFKAQPDLMQLMPVQRTTVPILGARWWSPFRRVAFELGIGAMVSGSYADLPSVPGGAVGDGPATTEMLVHLSVPIMLASTRHTILFLAPEFRAGFSRFQPDGSGDGVVTAATFDGSLKAGVEIFFSFLGLDNLSIEAGVRAGLTYEARYQVTSLPLQPINTAVNSQTRFTTSLIGNPWDLFTSTLAARYYF